MRWYLGRAPRGADLGRLVGETAADGRAHRAARCRGTRRPASRTISARKPCNPLTQPPCFSVSPRKPSCAKDSTRKATASADRLPVSPPRDDGADHDRELAEVHDQRAAAVRVQRALTRTADERGDREGLPQDADHDEHRPDEHCPEKSSLHGANLRHHAPRASAVVRRPLQDRGEAPRHGCHGISRAGDHAAGTAGTGERVDVRDAAAVAALLSEAAAGGRAAHRVPPGRARRVGGQRRRLGERRAGGRGSRCAPRPRVHRRRLRRAQGGAVCRGGRACPRAPTTAARRRRPSAASPPSTREALIVRTSLIVGGPGHEPSKHELAARDPDATFYDDELRSPVQVTDLARALLELADARRRRAAPRRRPGRRLPRRAGRARPRPARAPCAGAAGAPARLQARLVACAVAAAHGAARRPLGANSHRGVRAVESLPARVPRRRIQQT